MPVIEILAVLKDGDSRLNRSIAQVHPAVSSMDSCYFLQDRRFI